MFSLLCKIKQRNCTANHISHNRCQPGTSYSHFQHSNKYIIQHHIGNAGCNGQHQSKNRLFIYHKEILEADLQHKWYTSTNQDSPISHTAFHKKVAGSCKAHNRADKNKNNYRQYCTDSYNTVNQHGKILICQLLFPFSKCFGYQCTASRSQHKSNSSDNHGDRECNVNCGKCHSSHKIGYKQSIYHAVNGGNDHRNHRGQRKTQQAAVGKMIG